jgi:hypothetical protein
MSYGMTYDEFWNGDVSSHRAYREAHKLKMIEDNTKAWIQGQYVYEAIGAWAPIIRPFSKARKPGKYTDHPYDLFEEQRRERELAEQRERYERIKEKVAAFATKFNEENAKKKAAEENTPIGKEVEDNA